MGYFAFGFIYPSIQLLFFSFLFNSSLLPFDPCLKPSFSSLFSVTCPCYKQILIATLPLVGSTSYTIKTSNTKPLGSSLLVWGMSVVWHLAAFGPFCYVFYFPPSGIDRAKEGGDKALSRIPPTSMILPSYTFFHPTLF